MLLFFGENFDFKSIEQYRLHKVPRLECGMRELIQFAHMLLKNDGTGEIERLTQLVQHRHPALYIRRSCERKLPHDFRLYSLILNCFCPDAHGKQIT